MKRQFFFGAFLVIALLGAIVTQSYALAAPSSIDCSQPSSADCVNVDVGNGHYVEITGKAKEPVKTLPPPQQ